MQKIEQILYEPFSREQDRSTYSSYDLEYLSVTALYTGTIGGGGGGFGGFGGGGGGGGPKFKGSSPLPSYPVSLTPKVSNSGPVNKGSSPLKSGFAKEFNLGKGYVFDTLNIGGIELNLKIRPDKPHIPYDFEHLNIDFHYNKGKKKPIINKLHIPFNWDKDDD